MDVMNTNCFIINDMNRGLCSRSLYGGAIIYKQGSRFLANKVKRRHRYKQVRHLHHTQQTNIRWMCFRHILMIENLDKDLKYPKRPSKIFNYLENLLFFQIFVHNNVLVKTYYMHPNNIHIVDFLPRFNRYLICWWLQFKIKIHLLYTDFGLMGTLKSYQSFSLFQRLRFSFF